jgi:hypothetical protein
MHDDFEIKHVPVKRDRCIDIANDIPNVDSAHDSFTSKNNFSQLSKYTFAQIRVDPPLRRMAQHRSPETAVKYACSQNVALADAKVSWVGRSDCNPSPCQSIPPSP